MAESHITIPDGWNEVSIRMFQELDKVNELTGLERLIELVSILSNKDPEEIGKIDESNLEKLVSSVDWCFKQVTKDYKLELNIDDKDYYLIKLNSLTFGERVDLDSWTKNAVENLHKIIALLYRPEGEEYDTKLMNERAELFLDKVNISDVYGCIFFFSHIGQRYIENTPAYLYKMMETKN